MDLDLSLAPCASPPVILVYYMVFFRVFSSCSTSVWPCPVLGGGTYPTTTTLISCWPNTTTHDRASSSFVCDHHHHHQSAIAQIRSIDIFFPSTGSSTAAAVAGLCIWLGRNTQRRRYGSWYAALRHHSISDPNPEPRYGWRRIWQFREWSVLTHFHKTITYNNSNFRGTCPWWILLSPLNNSQSNHIGTYVFIIMFLRVISFVFH